MTAVPPSHVRHDSLLKKRARARATRAKAAPGDSQMSELHDALDRGEFFLLYQPKIAVRRRAVASAEALLRWQHPTKGLIMPDQFIPSAEANGAIARIAAWTLDRIVADYRRLARAKQPVRLYMNVSGNMLADENFIASACAIATRSRAEIGFEITETAVIDDPETAIANLTRCKAAGISLAIDDYGAGLSSLLYLKQLPADELKIDKAFITQLTNSHRDPLIVRSTIDLAHALDMEVTAEGVETPAALALLTVMGCEMVQGFLISKPVTLEALLAYLRAFDFEAMNLSDTPSVIRPPSFWARAQ